MEQNKPKTHAQIYVYLRQRKIEKPCKKVKKKEMLPVL